MPSKHIRKFAPFVAIVLAGACSGSTGGGGTNGGEGGSARDDVPGGGGDTGTQVCAVPQDGWSPAPMRRLTAAEYDNALADLLGEKRRLGSDALSFDEAVSGFAANTQVTVSVAEAEKLASAARAAAEGAAGRLGEVLKCASGQNDEACGLAFTERFGRLAFRRALTDEEKGTLSQVYKNKAKSTDHIQGVRLVIEAVLQMPQFLYRPALGSKTAQDGVNKLTGEEMASRLSFFFWSSLPDDDLLTAAEDGSLDSVDGIKTQVDRMMKDARFERTLESFSLQWLGLGAAPDKDAMEFAAFSPEVWASGKTSVAKFFSHIVKDTDSKMDTLFTAPVVFVDQQLSKTYGMTAKAGGFEKLATDPQKRGGIITQAAVLASLAGSTESSPVKRGVFVRSHLLCQTPPPPPPNGVPAFPPPAANQSQRQRLEAHRSNPSCASCHSFFDPLGLAFEHFDGVGVYRDKDHGVAVDASGELTETDVDGKFNNAVDLMNLLKGSQIAAECLTTQFYRFAVGRLESEADACVLKRLTSSLADGGYPLREVFSKLATSDAFRFVGQN